MGLLGWIVFILQLFARVLSLLLTASFGFSGVAKHLAQAQTQVLIFLKSNIIEYAS